MTYTSLRERADRRPAKPGSAVLERLRFLQPSLSARPLRLWAAFALVLAMGLALALPALSIPEEADGRGPFVDTDGTIHEEAVAALWAERITIGCREWRFCPEEPLTRAEMAAFLTRALDLPHLGLSGFIDVEESPFALDIAAIALAGITHGCHEEEFCPDQAVTREQMASFLSRALDLPPGEQDAFADDGTSVHTTDIDRIAAAGITRGCDADRYCPGRPVTRAEMATFLMRAFDLMPPEELPVIPLDVIEEYRAERNAPSWPTGPGAEGWRPLVELFFEPGDVDRAIRIIACESNGNPSARNPSSDASGLFQHMPRYWRERSSDAGYGGASILDPEANVATAAWLVYDYRAGGWGHWVCKG
ncbi:hypothetical protein BH23ACT5_BH23ACT5_23030 [soil metagenome]